MKCSKCGFINEDINKYCSHCGDRMQSDSLCKFCGGLIRSEDKFCGSCGARLIANENRSDNSFKSENNVRPVFTTCNKCGKALNSEGKCVWCDRSKTFKATGKDSKGVVTENPVRKSNSLPGILYVVTSIVLIGLIVALLFMPFLKTSISSTEIKINFIDMVKMFINSEQRATLLTNKKEFFILLGFCASYAILALMMVVNLFKLFGSIHSIKRGKGKSHVSMSFFILLMGVATFAVFKLYVKLIVEVVLVELIELGLIETIGEVAISSFTVFIMAVSIAIFVVNVLYSIYLKMKKQRLK